MASQGRRADGDPSGDVPGSPGPPRDADDSSDGARIDDLLERVTQPTLPAIERPFALMPEQSAPSLRTARVTRMADAGVELVLRGAEQPVPATLDPSVDRALIERTMQSGDAVLVETVPGQDPVVIGVVQTRLHERVEIKAKEIILDAEGEISLRAGQASIRLRQDGDAEIVGSRILTMSRGLIRIVGRVLRLS